MVWRRLHRNKVWTSYRHDTHPMISAESYASMTRWLLVGRSGIVTRKKLGRQNHEPCSCVSWQVEGLYGLRENWGCSVEEMKGKTEFAAGRRGKDGSEPRRYPGTGALFLSRSWIEYTRHTYSQLRYKQLQNMLRRKTVYLLQDAW